jgi:hypothetical protein
MGDLEEGPWEAGSQESGEFFVEFSDLLASHVFS